MPPLVLGQGSARVARQGAFFPLRAAAHPSEDGTPPFLIAAAMSREPGVPKKRPLPSKSARRDSVPRSRTVVWGRLNLLGQIFLGGSPCPKNYRLGTMSF